MRKTHVKDLDLKVGLVLVNRKLPHGRPTTPQLVTVLSGERGHTGNCPHPPWVLRGEEPREELREESVLCGDEPREESVFVREEPREMERAWV